MTRSKFRFILCCIALLFLASRCNLLAPANLPSDPDPPITQPTTPTNPPKETTPEVKPPEEDPVKVRPSKRK
ncbi:MAG: hypothetical protein AB8G15_13590, partial [Saprospiraceae bacterium]